jgi:PIN domain nuclease of toxin-antitoxin system
MIVGTDDFPKVLDASAMIAFLRNEPGAAVVEGLLLDTDHRCCAHAVQLCEVFYDTLRADGERYAQIALTRLEDAGLEIREDLDPVFWQAVGRLKVDPGGISLADAFLLALTVRTGGEAVTADHHELDRIAAIGLCPIRFIR